MSNARPSTTPRERMLRVMKSTALLADRVTPTRPGISILIYHRVGAGTDSAVDLPVDQFERQLDHLVAHHDVITLDDAVAALSGAVGDRESTATDRHRVVLTFDDGTDDFTDVVAPILHRRSLPATVYVATRFVDEGRPFPWGARPTTWSALRDATADGLITVGSHTHDHWLLDRQEPDVVVADLDWSCALIGEHVGAAPAHFAYPKGVRGDRAAEAAIKHRFASAALATAGLNVPGATDPYRLARTPVQRDDDQRFFAAKAVGGLRLETWARAAVSRLRYRRQSR